MSAKDRLQHRPFKSITYRLALYGLLVGVCLGVIVTIVQLAFDFNHEIARSDLETQNFIEAITPSVITAVTEVSPEKAQNAVTAIQNYPHFDEVVISTRDGQVLASHNETVEPDIKAWFVGLFTPLRREYRRELKIESLDFFVGELVIGVNQVRVLEPFFARANLIIIVGIMRNIVLSLLLIWFFQWLVTVPLLKFRRALVKVDPRHPKPLEGVNKLRDREDEIGEITNITDSILCSSQNYLREMHEAQELMRDYGRAASDWFCACDEEGNITYFSNQFFENFEVKPEEIYGKPLPKTGLMAPGQGEVLNKFNDYVHRTREPFRNFEFEMTDGAKSSRVTLSAVPYFDQDGNFAGYRGVCTDMTRIVDIEKEREILEKKLAHSENLRVVGQLTGGIAHDFNNILAIMLGNLEAAKLHEPDGALHEYLDTCIDAADKAASLTQRLLAFSRQQPLSPEVIQIDDVFARLRSLLRGTLGENIDLKFVADDDVWECMADPNQLETAMINLILNARDAIRKHGEITIRARNVHYDASEIPADCESKGLEFVCIEVEDNGTGIAPELVEQVFEPFFSTKPKEKGSGLGLSMVYGFSIQSGGFVTVKTALDEGTTIALNLPRTAEIYRLETQSHHLRENVNLAGMRVLVVEDDEAIRQTLKMSLKILGCQAFLATDEASARVAIKKHGPFDLFLFDVILQGASSGPEIFQNLKRDHLDAPVVFMSGYTRNVIDEQIGKDVHFELLKKPFQIQTLGVAISRAWSSEKKARDYQMVLK